MKIKLEDISDNCFELAKFARDRAIENINIIGGESFSSFLITIGSEQSKYRLIADDPVASIKMASSILSKPDIDADLYALLIDGYTKNDEGEKVDSIFIEVGEREAPVAAKFAQPYTLVDGEAKPEGKLMLIGAEESKFQATEIADDIVPEEFTSLIKAPFAVLSLVAGADGIIEKKEVDAFRKTLLGGMEKESEFVTNCIQHSLSEAPSLIEWLNSDEINAEEELKSVSQLLNDEYDAEHGGSYKAFLKSLAKDIAQPKGGFLGFGKKIAEEDKKAIDLVVECLD